MQELDFGERLVGKLVLFDLSHPLEFGMPTHPSHPKFFSMPWDSRDKSASNLLRIGEHAGTHLDSPSHLFPDGGLSVDEIPASELIGPAVKMDFHAQAEDSPDLEIGVEEIKAWERSHRQVEPGEAALLFFGWSSNWGMTRVQKDRYLNSWPSITRAGSEYLVQCGIRLVGTDCLSVDGPTNSSLESHQVFLENRVPILENLNALARLPDSFVLISLPLKIRGGTGSPVRVVAIANNGSENTQ